MTVVMAVGPGKWVCLTKVGPAQAKAVVKMIERRFPQGENKIPPFPAPALPPLI